MWSRKTRRFALLNLALLAAGCNHGMEDQPKVKPLAESDFFADGRSARPRVPGTVAHGHLEADSLLYTGKIGARDSDVFPFLVTAAVLQRGRERYDIYCSVCHDRAGTGDGMIVRRGFPRPPSFHIDRLRQAPVGHFFDVITNGFGRMYPYADRVTARDRWAIIAYLRALQLSSDARLADVPQGKLNP
jgi:hypothetical protein